MATPTAHPSLEILRVKADAFNEYARRSDLKDVTPDAVDIVHLTAAKEAATQAENERRIVEMERKRLRNGGSREGGPVSLASLPCCSPGPHYFPLLRTSAASSHIQKASSRGLEDRTEVAFAKLAVRPERRSTNTAGEAYPGPVPSRGPTGSPPGLAALPRRRHQGRLDRTVRPGATPRDRLAPAQRHSANAVPAVCWPAATSVRPCS